MIVYSKRQNGDVVALVVVAGRVCQLFALAKVWKNPHSTGRHFATTPAVGWVVDDFVPEGARRELELRAHKSLLRKVRDETLGPYLIGQGFASEDGLVVAVEKLAVSNRSLEPGEFLLHVDVDAS